MRQRLRNLIGFYSSGSGLIFLVGLAALTLRLIQVGPEVVLTVIGVAAVSIGLPMRLTSLIGGVWQALEEERRFTHQRLKTLEEGQTGSTSGQVDESSTNRR